MIIYNRFTIYIKIYIHTYIYTCKNAIQCRPWAPPPPSPIYTSSEPISNIFTFFGILRTNVYIWSAVFLNFENWKPLFGQKSKNGPKCGVVALFLYETILTYIQKRCEAWEYGAFSVFENIENWPFYYQKSNAPFYWVPGFRP